MLRPDDWERRLVAHYLRSDGPCGGGVLTWLDATPAELAIASGIDGIPDSEAQSAFLSPFRRGAVTDCLDGRMLPTALGAHGPGYFRYLVLTCLVSATDEGAGESHNFRTRLGELVDGDGPIQAVSGVNWLWNRLVDWCDHRRAAGEPFRKIALPPYGHMSLIGHAVRLAFPSWRDRSALTSILRALPDQVRRSPQPLVEELRRPHHWHALSPALQDAYRDFVQRLRGSSGLLGGHRFWRLVESIDERLQAEVGGAAARWRLELSFGGWEQDLAWGRLFRSRHRGTDAPPIWEGPFAELLRLDVSFLPTALDRALQQGALILGEARGAAWVVEDTGANLDNTVLILARTGNPARSWPLHTRWRDIGGEWACSDRLSADAVAGLARKVGLAAPVRERLLELGFEGGVPTRRGSWLGRPGFLPDIRTSPESQVAVRALPATTDVLGLGGGTMLRPLSANGPVSGRWTVSAREGGAEDERVLMLEAEYPERRDWPPETAAWAQEEELAPTGERPLVVHESASDEARASPSAVEHLTEALYARVGGGRGEAELVELLDRVLPEPWMTWDVLRGFQDAGWMEPRVYHAWRARRWRLAPPSLVTVAPHMVLIEGALGSAAFRRLAETAQRLDGHVRIAPADWSPPVVVVHGVDPALLAAELEWAQKACIRPVAAPAPACWPGETRSTDGRELVGIWDLETGVFRPPAGALTAFRLERWVQESDRDLYRVVQNEKEFVSTSRTVAVLEFHRRARRPLFRWEAGGLWRIGRGGNLPAPVARALRRRTLVPGGPCFSDDGQWTYVYPADRASAEWVGQLFGSAIEIGGEASRPSALLTRAARRRARLRPSWWSPSAVRSEFYA